MYVARIYDYWQGYAFSRVSPPVNNVHGLAYMMIFRRTRIIETDYWIQVRRIAQKPSID